MPRHIGGKTQRRYGVPYQGYSVFHIGEHRAAPTETSFHWEVNFGINHRLQVPRYFYPELLTYAIYFVIDIELKVIYLAIT